MFYCKNDAGFGGDLGPAAQPTQALQAGVDAAFTPDQNWSCTGSVKPEKFHSHVKASLKATCKPMEDVPGAPKFQWEVTRAPGLPKLCLKGNGFNLKPGSLKNLFIRISVAGPT